MALTGTTRKRLMVVGQGDGSTGFSRVLNSIIPHLTDRYEVHHFAINYRGEVKQYNEQYFVYPNNKEGDVHGTEQFGILLHQLKPDILFILQDAWYFQVHRDAVMEYPFPLAVVAYSAIDNAALNPGDFQDIDYIDQYVVFTEFARHNYESFAKKEQLKLPPVRVIPHGIDATLFYPVAGQNDLKQSRAEARKQLFVNKPGLEHDFIVLNANRNQHRKRIDLTIKAFALFSQNKPDVKLCLHMGMKHIGYDILDLVKQAGIEEKVMYTGNDEKHPEVTEEVLNLIYNACDVGLNTASAEGWGLVSFEHAASGVAQIVPDHTAFSEIWKDAAVFIPVHQTHRSEAVITAERHELDPQDIAAAMDQLYADRSLLEKTAQACYDRATHPDYNWKTIAQRFDALFTSLIP